MKKKKTIIRRHKPRGGYTKHTSLSERVAEPRRPRTQCVHGNVEGICYECVKVVAPDPADALQTPPAGYDGNHALDAGPQTLRERIRRCR